MPASIERNAYFVAAELLTNAAKHAEAPGHPPRGVDPRHGAGGAAGSTSGSPTTAAAAPPPRPGHGLAGLAERVQGLRGMLVVDSPVGGPTAIGAHIPYTPVAASVARPSGVVE